MSHYITLTSVVVNITVIQNKNCASLPLYVYRDVIAKCFTLQTVQSKYPFLFSTVTTLLFKLQSNALASDSQHKGTYVASVRSQWMKSGCVVQQVITLAGLWEGHLATNLALAVITTQHQVDNWPTQFRPENNLQTGVSL